MSDDLKQRIKEFSSIAKSCPDNLQEICFKLLLENYLGQNKNTPNKNTQHKNNDTLNGNESTQDTVKDQDDSQEDFKNTDLHVKARKFLTDNSLTIEHINQIFYKEGEKVEPLFDDLKTTKSAESQTRIALLQALKNSINTGNFQFDGEAVREETILRKCYDANNFTANFKNNKTFLMLLINMIKNPLRFD